MVIYTFIIFTVPPTKFTANLETVMEEYELGYAKAICPRLAQIIAAHETNLSTEKYPYRISGKFKLDHQVPKLFVFEFVNPKSLSSCGKMKSLLKTVIIRSMAKNKIPSVCEEEFSLITGPYRDQLSKIEIESLTDEISTINGLLDDFISVAASSDSIEQVKGAAQIL